MASTSPTRYFFCKAWSPFSWCQYSVASCGQRCGGLPFPQKHWQSSSVVKLRRRWKHSHSRVALLSLRYISFPAISSVCFSGGDGQRNIEIPRASETGVDACSLFREIGNRAESAAAAVYGKRIQNPPTSGATSSMTKRKTAACVVSEFCESYLSIPDDQPLSLSREGHPKREFIDVLLHEKYDVDAEAIAAAMRGSHSFPVRNSDILRLRELCTPRYESIFHYILGSASQDLGVAFLVKLRRDIRDLIRYYKFTKREENGCKGERGHDIFELRTIRLSKLQRLERSIQTILTSLFRPGVLNLRRITYQDTPASIIEQIAFKEAVHPLQSLQDLRTRLGPGRRCFAFFHPALPNVPLVFVHVALLTNMPESMGDLQWATEKGTVHCAAFYSITNTEAGLAGVDLGNHLIKSVVQVLRGEFPSLAEFCTLSPIPKFKNWLEAKIALFSGVSHGAGKANQDYDDDRYHKFPNNNILSPADLQRLQDTFSSEYPLLDLLEKLRSPTWHTDSPCGDKSPDGGLADQLRPLLMKLAAYYLTIETRQGRPLCPVAKFHIRNGAEMYRLNFMADLSMKGMRNSCGMMINYRYLLDEMEDNRVGYELSGDFPVKDGVKRWLDGRRIAAKEGNKRDENL